jgi:membrane-bound metal-dependent hydrolase YbcI (DUF457 family)
MFAGHVGAAMAIARAERRVNLGVVVFAAMLLDFVLWLLALLGWESVVLPADFNNTHQPQFVFPYSHGLLASMCWSLLAGGATFLWYPRLNRARLRAAALVSAAVFSHWLLDALVHAPELPVAGASSAKVGLSLWQHMPVALAVEAFIALSGLYLFVSGTRLSRPRRFWLSALSVLVVLFTVFGMTVAPPPPSVVAMAASSLVTIVAVSAIAGWLGRTDERRT